MKISKGEHGYFNTENDYKFGEQITLDGQILVPLKTGQWEEKTCYTCDLPDGLRCENNRICTGCDWSRPYIKRYCSKCGCVEPVYANDFCPNCGAKMESEEE